MITPLINSILAQAPQTGRIERIALRPGKGKPLVEVQSWDRSSGPKDYGPTKERAVTLLSLIHI